MTDLESKLRALQDEYYTKDSRPVVDLIRTAANLALEAAAEVLDADRADHREATGHIVPQWCSDYGCSDISRPAAAIRSLIHRPSEEG